MRFLRENSYLMIRLLMTHVGMFVFATVLTVASTAYTEILLVVSIFSVIFHMALAYVATWDRGAKDFIRVDAGRDTRRLWTGFAAGGMAAIPGLILVLLMLIGHLTANADFFAVVRVIIFLWQAPFTGIISTAFDANAFAIFGLSVGDSDIFYLLMTVAYFVSLIPPIVGAGVGYVFGYKNRRIFGSLFDSRPKNEK